MKWSVLLCLSWSASTAAEEALVAVATNFTATAEQLVAEFQASSGHRVTIASGSTGKLYAQILHGAPFDVLLAADQARPALLEESGNGVAGSRFTYASGRLAVWSRDGDMIRPGLRETLLQGTIRSVAIANPELAPYGAASRDALTSLGLWDTLRHKIVMGENIGQTHALVATGNAQIGFVAMSYVLDSRNRRQARFIEVDPGLYLPIRQDAVLLKHGAENVAAKAFLEFLKDRKARDLIGSRGYGFG